MKPRLVHDVTVTPYDFWAQPTAPLQFEWMCCCGELGSGHATEQAATEAGHVHADPLNTAAMTVTMGNGHQSVYDPHAGVWRSASATVLAVGVWGWAAFGVVGWMLAIIAMGVAIKRGQRPVPDLPPWLSDIDQEGGPQTPLIQPDPAWLWGAVSTDRMPPQVGDRVDVPGYSFVFNGDDWERV